MLTVPFISGRFWVCLDACGLWLGVNRHSVVVVVAVVVVAGVVGRAVLTTPSFPGLFLLCVLGCGLWFWCWLWWLWLGVGVWCVEGAALLWWPLCCCPGFGVGSSGVLLGLLKHGNSTRLISGDCSVGLSGCCCCNGLCGHCCFD